MGDVCEDDSDQDGVPNPLDNCPTHFNPAQDGGLPIKLSGPHSFGINGPTISADSARFVYRNLQGSVHQLFSVPIVGGAVTTLNPVLPIGGHVQGALVSPDGTTVVYLATATPNFPTSIEPYSVPIGGGTSTRLCPPLSARCNVTSYVISGDSARVVFYGSEDGAKRELYSVPIDGGSATRINAPLISTADVSGYVVSPDSTTVVYRADHGLDGVFELHSVSIDGGTVTKLHPDVSFGGSVENNFTISPDSSMVIYRADQDTENVSELYSVPILGGAVTKLNPAFPIGRGIAGAFIAPDSTRVVYLADQDTDTVNELYSVPITGGSVTKLNPDFR